MVVGTIFSITPAFVYWLAGYLAIHHDPSAPTIGSIVAFTTLQSRLFFPLGQLLGVQVEIQGALALFDRIFEYLEMAPEIADAPDAVALDPAAVRGGIRFRHVDFRYKSTPPPLPDGPVATLEPDLAAAVPTLAETPDPLLESAPPALPPVPFGLEDVDFEADPGELVALVGPTGAGKTSTISPPRTASARPSSSPVSLSPPSPRKAAWMLTRRMSQSHPPRPDIMVDA